MKKKCLFLLTLITLSLSLSSCGSKASSEETKGTTVTLETTVVSESEATATPEVASTESVVYSSEPTPTPTLTPTAEESTMTAEEVLATVPTNVYNTSDTSLTLDEQKEKAKDALHNGTITDRQYAVISEDIRERKAASSSTGSTGSSTSGDTYIPAHGNPGTPDTGEMLGYEGRIEDAPDVSNSRLD